MAKLLFVRKARPFEFTRKIIDFTHIEPELTFGLCVYVCLWRVVFLEAPIEFRLAGQKSSEES